MALKPGYTITNNILKFVSSADTSKALIENSPIIPYWERTFQNQAMIRSVHHSTAIEGNELNIDEAEKIIEGERVETYRLRDIKEIVNYREAIGFISGDQNSHITTGLLNGVHKVLGEGILTDSHLGIFRKKKAVIVNNRSGEVVFDAPEPSELESEINDLIEWDMGEAKDVHPLIKAAIIHFELVRIHPYVDINGRTARIIATWSLYRDGYDIKKFFSLEEHYDQDLQRYYDSLDSAHDGDYTNWIEYFTQGVAEELSRITEKVMALSRDRILRSKIGQVALSDRQLKIINFLAENEELKNPDFDIVLPKVSEDTILRDLNDLKDKGIIKKIGRTKGAKYILV